MSDRRADAQAAWDAYRHARRRRWRWVRVFVRAFDTHVLAITALALAATWVSLRWNIVADLPGEIIAVAIVFPIVFSIRAAYKRREDALRMLGRLRSLLLSVWLAHRDWPPDGGEAAAERAGVLVRRLDAVVRDALVDNRTAHPEVVLETGRLFSDLSRSIEALRRTGVPGTELSRVNQYLSQALGEWENLRSVVEYRTPASLRAHSKMFLNVFPVLYAPAYAHIAQEGGAPLGYAIAAAVAVVLVGLDNIQDGLEHPFDRRGLDDVDLTLGGLVLPDAGPTAPADARTP